MVKLVTNASFRSAAPCALLLVLAALTSGCGGDPDSPIGDMADTSYYGMRGKVSRPNALGEPVELEQFAGRFVWADYAAPWCGPCRAQAQAIKRAESSFRTGVVFLTIMTSDQGGYGDPATPQTAGNWAVRFALDPERVLAADLTSMTIPKHILYSPDGHVLFQKTGGMSADQIRTTLLRYMEDWMRWKATGDRARWMHGL